MVLLVVPEMIEVVGPESPVILAFAMVVLLIIAVIGTESLFPRPYRMPRNFESSMEFSKNIVLILKKAALVSKLSEPA